MKGDLIYLLFLFVFRAKEVRDDLRTQEQRVKKIKSMFVYYSSCC